MLRWIVPYLYERSQVEDALSAEDLLVALIAPWISCGLLAPPPLERGGAFSTCRKTPCLRHVFFDVSPPAT